MDRQRANVGMNRQWNTCWSAWKSSTPELDHAPSIGRESCSDSNRILSVSIICARVHCIHRHNIINTALTPHAIIVDHRGLTLTAIFMLANWQSPVIKCA